MQKFNLDEDGVEIEKVIRDFDNHIETGFQLATFQGPLCAEPVEGMAYFVEQVEVDRESLEKELGKFDDTFSHLFLLLKCTRAKPNVSSNWIIDIGRKRCLPEWFIRLVPQIDACHVYLRNSSTQ